MNIDNIVKAYNLNNYSYDMTRPFYLNIFGIRGYWKYWNNNEFDRFNDTIGIMFVDDNKNQNCILFRATTDPGQYYLDNPVNNEGTAQLKTGNYKNCYKIDLHNGKYEALCQRLGKVTVNRLKKETKNNDTFISVKEETGMFSINIHKGADEVNNVYNASAGCQVYYDREDFDIFMTFCKKHRELYGNIFTYTLFDNKSFQEKI